MATIRLKYIKLDENVRLRGLEMRNYLRGPQVNERTGQFMMLDGVNMTLNDQTGIMRLAKEGSDVHLVHISRAWNVIEYRPEEVKLVDEEVAKYKAARAEADAERAKKVA